MLTVLSAAPSQTLADRLDPPGERAVVDDFVADRIDAADPVERLAPDQHAAASRRRGAPRRIGDVPRRVKLEEEKHESRDQQPLPRGAAMQFDHQRNKIVAAAFGPRDELGEIIRRVHDIGVGQQQIIRFERAGGLDAVANGPELAGPARRNRLRPDDAEPIRGADRRRRGSAPSPRFRRCCGRRRR